MKQDTFISIKFRRRVRYILSASAFVSRVLPASIQMTVNKFYLQRPLLHNNGIICRAPKRSTFLISRGNEIYLSNIIFTSNAGVVPAAAPFTQGSLILLFDPSTNNRTKCCFLTDSFLWYSGLTPCNLEGYDSVFRRHVLLPVASSVK